MNYIKEINAFYDWLETNSVPDSAIVLWHALMHISNKTGWAPEFAVAISTLSTKTGLKKDAIIRGRHRLQQVGRIDFSSRSGQQSAVYRIIPFVSEITTLSATQTDSVVLSDTNRNTNREQTATQSATQTASITKQNETTITKNDDDARAALVDLDAKFSIAYKAIDGQFPGRTNSIQSEELARYLQQGMDPEIVIRAVKIARLGGEGIRFFWGVLANCEERGIFTLEAFEEDQARHKGGRQSRSNGNRSGKPSLPIVQSNGDEPTMTADEYIDALQRARQMESKEPLTNEEIEQVKRDYLAEVGK